MPISYNHNEGSMDFKPEPKKRWKSELLIIGGVSAGVFWLLTQLDVSYRPTVSVSTPVTQLAPEASRPAIAPSSSTIASPSPVIASPAPAATRPVTATQPTVQQPVALVTNNSLVQRQAAALSQLPELPHRVQALDSLVALTQNIQTLTPRQMKELPRLVRKLRYQGAAVVPAIRDFLQTKADFNFDNIQGSEMASHRTLRLALIDTLGQIGGKEAIAALDEQLKNSTDAVEIAALRRGLTQQVQ